MVHLPFVRKVSDRNTYLFLGGVKASILVDGEDTKGHHSVVLMEERRGLEPPPHIHTNDDEAFYVLEGEVSYYIKDKVVHATPGTYVFAPRGMQHTYKLETEEAKVLVFNYPAGFDQFVKELSVPFPDHLPPIPTEPPSSKEQATLNSIAAKYGIMFQT